MLHVLVKPANPTLALVAALARLAMTVVQGINLFNYFTPLLLLSSADYVRVFDPRQLQALALLFLNAHEYMRFCLGAVYA